MIHTFNDFPETTQKLLDLDGRLALLRRGRDIARTERQRKLILNEITKVTAEQLQLIARYHEERYGK